MACTLRSRRVWSSILASVTTRVWLYDMGGRLLATRQDEHAPLHFDIPASGAYLVKVGNYAARRIVVIR